MLIYYKTDIKESKIRNGDITCAFIISIYTLTITMHKVNNIEL